MDRKYLALSFLLVPVTGAGAGTIEAVEPALGREEFAVTSPIYESDTGVGIAFEAFDSEFDHNLLLFDDLNVTGTKDKLQSTVDLGQIVSTEIEFQARAMGMPVTESGWLVKGTVKDVLVKNREIAFGPLLFYGHVTLAMDVTSPDGETTSVQWSFHPTSAKYNAGFGAKDENREALAEIVVLASQQAVARLNREFVGSLPSAAAKADIDALGGSEPSHGTLRRVGLAGDPSAVGPLLDLIERIDNEHIRADAVQALGLLGSSQATDKLKGRYLAEDEDVRYATIVALSEIGGEEEFIAQRGAGDESRAIRDLSGRLAGKHR